MERGNQNAPLQAPLIQHSGHDGVMLDNDTEQNNKRVIERREIFEEIKLQFWLAVPLVSVGLFNFCIQLISVMFVGHLGELALPGASMATSFCSVTGFSLLIGMASALDTLCGQSYGAKQHHMLGVHTQGAMIVLMIVSIPLAIIWANTRSILVFLGQDPEISAEAGRYSQLLVPSLFAYGLLMCLNRFLQSQNIVFPMMFISGVTTLLHLPVCWMMVYKSGLGSRGAAIANSISYWINVFILSLYVKCSPKCAKTWTGFSKAALHNVPSFTRLAIPSAIMSDTLMCVQLLSPITVSSLENWSFEMMVLLSGLLPNPKLETSVLSICLNTGTAAWMIPYGLGAAASTRVSNELGAGRPWIARLAVCVVSVMAIFEGVVIGTVMILIRNIWGHAYSDEQQVVKYVSIMMPLLALSSFVDSLLGVLSGTCRGCGWQKIGKGLWMGIICGLVVQVLCLLIITLRTDWAEEAKNARARVYDSVIPEDIVS
ncbi:hypothetical protein Fmac_003658 [Flemingia macrophylla]|uniref:Protein DETOXIFICATION n=1 Tax=Flemingia macrophylla TaxID=520843 RepID=A0ABD1N2Q7_9FABA